jgi:hypothetical protein
MKKLLFVLLITCSFAAKAQVYNNEWIKYSQTYYKLKVGRTGLYRITQPVLANAGLGGVDVTQFQLWRNGKEVPIYTSAPSGNLSSTDYIEFWGEMNDGAPDNELYRVSDYHLNRKWSLETDTAAYFLTVTTDPSRRLVNRPHNVETNTLPPEPYFMHTAGRYYRDKLHAGYAVNVGEYLYSSSYDKAEGWSSSDMDSNITLTHTFNDLYLYQGAAPTPTFSIFVSGNAIRPRRYRVVMNGDTLFNHSVDYFNYVRDTVNVPVTLLATNAATVQVNNRATTRPDRMVVHQMELTYPRQFHFGNSSNFEFGLPASVQGQYLQITGFTYGSVAPVLYDLTNGHRYVTDISTAGQVRVVLGPSAAARKLVLVSEAASNIININDLRQRNFIDYSQPAMQGDYLIISNPHLFTSSTGNPVEAYRAYRSSAQGRGYNAKIFLAEELIDQFGFGIKKNPAGIRNFILWARAKFTMPVRQVFIIGKGVNYVSHRLSEAHADMDRLNLVPAFGWPASDVLLTANPGSSQPEVPIGRLSVINGEEVNIYLKKIKEYEVVQSSSNSPLIADRAWMKNIVHIIGAGEGTLDTTLKEMMGRYAGIIQDTLFGGKVTTFSKTSSNTVEQLNNTHMQNLFYDGISLMTYFGHSSATTLEFNLDNPENYNNPSKYPIFLGLGCNAGNFFNFNPVRFQTKETLSERYVLSSNRGTIGFVASTHFGIVHYLDIWATRAYKRMGYLSYDKTFGEVMKETVSDVFAFSTQEDFYARANAEQTELHGDPALRLNSHTKPDYVIEDQMLKISPGFISILESEFRVDARAMNIGRAPDKPIVVQLSRTYPNGTTVIVKRDTIPGIRYERNFVYRVPIDDTRDKGLNRITLTIDADNDADEYYETNNSITKEVFIYEDEARPVFPYNLAIVNKQNIKLKASTADPFSGLKQYRMEMDTTELFNSPLKVTSNISSIGGVIEFDPGITFTDSTVYYWRVAPVPLNGDFNWNSASFIYLANFDDGFNQSHRFQHYKSSSEDMSFDSSTVEWKYGTRINNLFVRTGTWLVSVVQEAGLSISVNSSAFIRNTCYFQSLVFNVFDPVTFNAWRNQTLVNGAYTNPVQVGQGLYNSTANNCFPGREFNFEYKYVDSASRRKAMDFMRDAVPDGAYVVVRSFLLDPQHSAEQAFANDWKADENVYGPGRSLYHSLKNAGFTDVDSFNRPRQFIFIYKKNDPSFTPKWSFTNGTFDVGTLSADCPTPDTIGYINSPVFGPSKGWKQLRWQGRSMDAGPGDKPTVEVVGIKFNGTRDTLIRNIAPTAQGYDISGINADEYPYVQLNLRNVDGVNMTPYQLRYWRLTYLPAPEGSVAPNVYFSMRDTVEVGEPLEFKMAFKNVSEVPFDSLKVKMVITDRNNRSYDLPVVRHRPLSVNDTLHVVHRIDTRQLTGMNSLYVEVNPDNDQPEQYHFNNFIYRNMFVRADTLNPLLDVTFDNVHILNHDIVSSKPDIVIRLKDEAKWNLLDDTSVFNIAIRFPNGTVRNFHFDNDTLRFIPAGTGVNNTASAQLKPFFKEDGIYEMIVTGRDMSENKSGRIEYRVAFQVINTPMISNMLNYPNPFTTSTAFVFTLTGSEVPQNLRIQILTVTGKVVREITKDELGPLRIGRNITEFKWDGTDMYGQKLANGVYLYRVITNLNGKSLDKYKSSQDNTDQYFNKGYGKMYLMR